MLINLANNCRWDQMRWFVWLKKQKQMLVRLWFPGLKHKTWNIWTFCYECKILIFCFILQTVFYDLVEPTLIGYASKQNDQLVAEPGLKSPGEFVIVIAIRQCLYGKCARYLSAINKLISDSHKLIFLLRAYLSKSWIL